MTAQAGWYPDPEGDASRLRYWDGAQWTEHYTPNPATQPAQQYETAEQAQAEYVQATTIPDSTSAGEYQVYDAEQIYPMTSQDHTLRLIAFILNIVSCVSLAPFIIPLAWGVPMTVRSWKIYKGKKPNTVAFGVLTLIFLNLIAGILLLCSNKDNA